MPKESRLQNIRSRALIKSDGKVDFEKNQSVDFVIENRTSDPSSPVTGQMWFRTDV